MDRPWSFHLPKGILFVIVEGLLITTAVVTGRGVRQASAYAQVCAWQVYCSALPRACMHLPSPTQRARDIVKTGATSSWLFL